MLPAGGPASGALGGAATEGEARLEADSPETAVAGLPHLGLHEIGHDLQEAFLGLPRQPQAAGEVPTLRGVAALPDEPIHFHRIHAEGSDFAHEALRGLEDPAALQVLLGL